MKTIVLFSEIVYTIVSKIWLRKSCNSV